MLELDVLGFIHRLCYFNRVVRYVPVPRLDILEDVFAVVLVPDGLGQHAQVLNCVFASGCFAVLLLFHLQLLGDLSFQPLLAESVVIELLNVYQESAYARSVDGRLHSLISLLLVLADVGDGLGLGQFSVALEYGVEDQLDNGLAPLESDEADLRTPAHHQVLQEHFTKHFVLVRSFDLLDGDGFYEARSSVLPVLLEALPIESTKNWASAATRAVHRAQTVDKQLEETIHISVVRYHEVNITVAQLKCNALPAVERKAFQFCLCHANHLLAQNPEPGGEAPENDVLDLFQVTAAGRDALAEVRVVLHFLPSLGRPVVVDSLQLRKRHAPTLGQLLRIGFVGVRDAANRYPVRDRQSLEVCGELEDGLVSLVLLGAAIHIVVVFDASYEVLGEVALNLCNLLDIHD